MKICQDITKSEEKPIHLIRFCMNRKKERSVVLLPHPLILPSRTKFSVSFFLLRISGHLLCNFVKHKMNFFFIKFYHFLNQFSKLLNRGFNFLSNLYFFMLLACIWCLKLSPSFFEQHLNQLLPFYIHSKTLT